ncbi:PPR repeat [Musa troglodytarum]|uniref:PPR repeat n=1 Tax=Musa troglodytarum TaxID=320322 RepID=A0A9E7KGN0_9LILI|nr:PPR repeat [Musa troglodytarum]
MWWRSRASVVLLRYLIRRPFPSQSKRGSSETLSPIPPFALGWARPVNLRFQNLRFFSSPNEAVSGDDEDKNRGFDFVESSDSLISDAGETGFDGVDDGGEGSCGLDGGKDESQVGAESLRSLWEEIIQDDDSLGMFAAKEPVGEAAEDQGSVTEIDIQQVDKVRSLLRDSSEEPLESSLDKIEVSLSEELVAMVLQTPYVSGHNLVGFFRWALRREESVRSLRMVELLVNALSSSADPDKMEAYKLWDLIKEIGSEKGLVNTSILNQLISMFGRLEKGRAGLEVFNKFDEFSCNPDGNTYCLTIEALRKQSMVNAAWSVCEKMLSSGNLPDGEKLGKVTAFFCKWKRAKEAHLVYLMAQENKIFLPISSLDYLVSSLSRKDETVRIALELLDNYPTDSLKYANMTFGTVVRGLCRVKEPQEAKKLLLRMVQSGPAPGSAVFNYVITALSKGGEMEDAIAVMKIMEGRGLRPDIYTYSVIMSGFAKGGLMDEAYGIYREAKKNHAKLSPVTYHILIRGYCKMEEYDKALNCLKEMKDDGVQPNVDEYNKLIQTLCLKAVDWRTAEKLLEEMKESGLILKGITRSLISAVKELEQEAQSESVHAEA